MAKKILLNNGQFAIVSNSDFIFLNKFKWYVSNYGYVVRSESRKMIRMHRLVMNTPANLKTDHLNNNKLDNRRENLRICTDSENMKNRLKQINNKSGFIGVSLYKRTKKWRAYIKTKYKEIHLGYFDSLTEAAKTYDKMAIRLGFLKGNFYGS